ncbi:MAG TPA: nucleotidyl transferase AbiEii/AbiGii toxin family protein [Pararobbsia sp.]|nr:nucleotidyl transferase AbiEii/AbiGii toxin family protein [Pararobbsia sp.]
MKQHSDASKQDFNLTLTQFGLERLLYRLSISRHASNYLLKGALLFSLWYDHAHRPTRDADLLGYGPDDTASAILAFREIFKQCLWASATPSHETQPNRNSGQRS